MAIKDKYQIERNYIDNPIARSREPIEEVQFIVDHETANNTADADDHQAYFNNIDFAASAHTFIDDTKILEIIPLDEKAWHVQYQKPIDNRMFGEDANDAAIGPELCRTGNFDEAYDRYVWYNAYLCHKFGLKPREHIVAHSTLDPHRRSDPESWLVPNGITWEEFIDDVQAYYDNWHGESAKKTYEPQERRTKAEIIVKQEENSIVDYLNARRRDSSFSARAKLAEEYGIENYQGTAEQNLRLLDLLKIKEEVRKEVEYSGSSIVDYLNIIKVDSSFSNRAKLAKQYGINNYEGTAEQNIELLNKMRVGGAEPKQTQPDYIGKRVESKVDGLRYYHKPTWSDNGLVNTLPEGWGFPTILDKIKVGGGHQYKVANSDGDVYYITASDKYVRVV